MADGQATTNGISSEALPSASSTPKGVTITEPEGIPPIYSELGEPINNSYSQSAKKHRVGGARRLSGRLNRPSLEQLPKILSHAFTKSPGILPVESDASNDQKNSNDAHTSLLSQVTEWLHDERRKRLHRSSKDPHGMDFALQKLEKILAEHAAVFKHQSKREDNDGYFSAKRKSLSRKLKTSSYTHPSDTEYHQDGDPIVPSTDVVLDNSKTVGHTGAQEGDGWLQFKNEIVRLTHTLRLKGWRRVPLDRGVELEVQRISGALTNAVYMVSPPNLAAETPTSDESTREYVSRRRPTKILLRVYGPNAGHLIDRDKELEVLKRLARKKIGPRLLGTFHNGRFEQYLNARPLTPNELRDPEISKQIAKRMRELHDGIELTREERSAGPLLWQNWDKWVKRCRDIIEWLDEQILHQEKPPKSKADTWKTRGLVCGVPWAFFRNAVENYRKWLEGQYGGKKSVLDHLVFAHNDTQYGNILRIEPTGESPLLLPANEHKQLVVIDFEYANANTPGLEFANHFTEWCYNYHSPTAPWVCNAAMYPQLEEQRRFIRAYVQHQPGFGASSPALTESVDQAPSSVIPSTSTSSLSSSLLLSRQLANTSTSSMLSTNSKTETLSQEKTNARIDYLMTGARLWRAANSAQWVAWGIVQAKVQGMEEALEARRRQSQSQKQEAMHNGVGRKGSASSTSPKRPADLLNVNGSCRGMNSGEVEKKEEELEASRPPVDCEIRNGISGSLDSGDSGMSGGDEIEEGGKEEKKIDEDATEEEGGFDYLAYAQDRALFFWGDMLELGLVREEELPPEVVRRAKRLPH